MADFILKAGPNELKVADTETHDIDALTINGEKVFTSNDIKDALTGITGGSVKLHKTDTDTIALSGAGTSSSKLSGEVTLPRANATTIGVVKYTSDISTSTTEAITIDKVTEVNNSIGDLVKKTATINGQPLSSNIVISKSTLGISAADNTSDEDKPISTSQANLLDTYSPIEHTHALHEMVAVGASKNEHGIGVLVNDVTEPRGNGGATPKAITSLKNKYEDIILKAENKIPTEALPVVYWIPSDDMVVIDNWTLSIPVSTYLYYDRVYNLPAEEITFDESIGDDRTIYFYLARSDGEFSYTYGAEGDGVGDHVDSYIDLGSIQITSSGIVSESGLINFPQTISLELFKELIDHIDSPTPHELTDISDEQLGLNQIEKDFHTTTYMHNFTSHAMYDEWTWRSRSRDNIIKSITSNNEVNLFVNNDLISVATTFPDVNSNLLKKGLHGFFKDTTGTMAWYNVNCKDDDATLLISLGEYGSSRLVLNTYNGYLELVDIDTGIVSRSFDLDISNIISSMVWRGPGSPVGFGYGYFGEYDDIVLSKCIDLGTVAINLKYNTVDLEIVTYNKETDTQSYLNYDISETDVLKYTVASDRLGLIFANNGATDAEVIIENFLYERNSDVDSYVSPKAHREVISNDGGLAIEQYLNRQLDLIGNKRVLPIPKGCAKIAFSISEPTNTEFHGNSFRAYIGDIGEKRLTECVMDMRDYRFGEGVLLLYKVRLNYDVFIEDEDAIYKAKIYGLRTFEDY